MNYEYDGSTHSISDAELDQTEKKHERQEANNNRYMSTKQDNYNESVKDFSMQTYDKGELDNFFIF